MFYLLITSLKNFTRHAMRYINLRFTYLYTQCRTCKKLDSTIELVRMKTVKKSRKNCQTR